LGGEGSLFSKNLNMGINFWSCHCADLMKILVKSSYLYRASMAIKPLYYPTDAQIYRVSISLEAPNYCQCIQSNSAGFSFVNTGKQVHLKHARWHFEWNLVKDVHHRSVASRNWLKFRDKGKPI